MKITVVKETRIPENRVALTPDVVKSLTKAGFTCTIESGAGIASGFYDTKYEEAGAAVSADKLALLAEADILLKVNAPTLDEVRWQCIYLFLICLHRT